MSNLSNVEWARLVAALPEDAADLVSCASFGWQCRCVHDYVPAPADAADAAYFGRPQRNYLALVDYVGNCPYGDHAQRYLDKLWAKAHTGTVPY